MACRKVYGSSLAERLEMYCQRTLNGCWTWTGASNRLGYGSVTADDGRTVYAHRASYERHVGPIPAGLHLDHLCRNPSCINPAHLEPVTPAENTRRGVGNRQSEKTHCPQGHPYDEANTHVGRRGDGRTFRLCRTCMREREARRAQRAS